MFVQVGRSVRRAITFSIAFMMMVGSFAMPTATLAQAQTIQSSLTGVTIAYEAPYTLFEDGQYADENMETMMFVGPADILAMGFMSPLIDLNGARDIMLEALFGEIGSAQTIDRGDYSGVSYSLDMLNIEGQEMGVFSLFMNQRSHGFSEFYIFLAPPTLFASSMQSAQASFTIDGAPLMDGVDPTVMGSMVTENIGITGGEAVTDVSDVAEPDDADTNTTETTTPSDDTTTTGQGDEMTYLLEVMAEYSQVDTSIGNIVTALEQYNNEELTAQEAFDIVDAEAVFLSGVSDRVALIQVPPGMENFHQETLEWATAVTAIGTSWIESASGNGTGTSAGEALSNGIDVHIAFGESLQTQQVSIDDSGDATTGTSNTSETTETTTTETTEADQTGTDAGDASSYIESIQTHRAEFFMSLGTFNDEVAKITDNSTDEEIVAVFNATTAEAEYWIGFSANAQQVTPPPGYEGVHEVYLEWAGHITELGNIWIAAMNGDQTQIDAFFDYLPIVQQADDDLQAAITDANAQNSGSDTATTGSDDTATGETTSRTTRSTGSSDTGDTGNTSETTGVADDGDDEDESGRPSRTQRSGDTGNTSETSGRTGRGGTDADASTSETADLPNELMVEATGANITYSDDLSLDEREGEAVTSSTSAVEDSVQFLVTAPDGGEIGFTLLVQANQGTDATSTVDALVNDPDALANMFADEVEILDYEIASDQSGVLVQAVDAQGEYYVYLQVSCVTADCDTVATLIVLGDDGETLTAALETIEVGLAVNDTPVTGAIPVLDIGDVINQVSN